MEKSKSMWFVKRCVFFIALFLSTTCLMAQSIKITGTVLDEQSESIIGASVSVKGSTVGTVADLDGNFTLDVPNENSVLLVTYIGYVKQEIKVGSTRKFNIVLKEDNQQLDEIVVVGYGVQKKSDITGSLSSIKGDELSKLSISRADEALQGQMAGVMIQNKVAAPGESPKILIRGGNSIKGDNAPLVVIDGVLGGDLSLIDPNDIQSMEVLKDASATSIYGSRGANGVVMVTTKRGASGRTSVSYNGYITASSVSKKLETLNSEELWGLLQEMTEKHPTVAMTMPEWFDPNNLNHTDWQDEVFRTAITTGHSLSISGGNENTRFNISGNYLSQEGIIKKSDFTRAGIRVNLDQKISNKLMMGVSINASRSSSSNTSMNQMNGSDGGGVVFTALGMGPLVPVYDKNGNYSQPLKSSAQLNNPVALINDKTIDMTRNYFQGTAYAEWEIIKDLKFKTSWTYTNSDRKQKKFVSGANLLEEKGRGLAEVYDRETENWLSENTITYSKTFAQKHSINAVAGFTAEETSYFNNTNTARGFDIESLGYWNMGLSDASQRTITTGESTSTIASWLGRVNYAFDGKYLLSASIRADGASKFAKNNKWGYFPAVAVGWRITEENFMKDISWVHNLKLRASYGSTGSQAIDPYQSLANYKLTTYTLNGASVVGLIPDRVPNPDLKWETTRQTNVGLDMSFFGGRLDIVADYYHKKTVDLHYDKELAYYTGYTSQTQNIGSKQNKGWEFSVNTQNLTGAFKWSTSFNIAFNKEKVLDLGGDQFFYTDGSGGALGADFRETSIVKIGESLGSFYGYKFDGIIQNEAEAKQWGSRVGAVKYKDISGPDGVPDGKITTDDRTIIGNANPDFIFGIGNNFSYKNFDLSFLFQGTYGNDIMNLLKVTYLNAPNKTNSIGNSFREVLDSWRGEGTSNTQQALNEGAGLPSDRFIEDGSYIRLKNLTLGYTLPRSLTSKWGVSNLRVYISGQNLFTITDYSGYDPEVDSRTDTAARRNLALGYDAGSYPATRSYTFGLSVTF